MNTKSNLHPARDELEARKKREAIELCGKNRGPHDYIPIEWMITAPSGNLPQMERVTKLLCRICFCNVKTSTLIEAYTEITTN